MIRQVGGRQKAVVGISRTPTSVAQSFYIKGRFILQIVSARKDKWEGNIKAYVKL